MNSPANSTHNLGFVVRLDQQRHQPGFEPALDHEEWAAGLGDAAQDRSLGRQRPECPVRQREGGDDRPREIYRHLQHPAPAYGEHGGGSGLQGHGCAGTSSSGLLAYNQIDYRNLPANLDPFTASGVTLLNSPGRVGRRQRGRNQGAVCGVQYSVGRVATVRQALRPFPQFSGIDTYNGSGDRLGHHTYHSMMLKFEKRYSGRPDLPGVLCPLQGTGGRGRRRAWTTINRRLEKTIESNRPDPRREGQLRVRAALRAGPEVPEQRRGLEDHRAAGVASASQMYVERNADVSRHDHQLPVSAAGGNRPTITTYDGWRGAISGEKFDPAKDSFLQPATLFGTQPTDRFGNMTRYNPKLRSMPVFSEDVSVARSIQNQGRDRPRLPLRGVQPSEPDPFWLL